MLGTWITGWKVNHLVAGNSVPRQDSAWAFVAGSLYPRLLKNLIKEKENKIKMFDNC